MGVAKVTLRSSPYQGLVPFDQADAPFFFGREKESRLIAANLSASPLTLLYGASGVGKSSILRAGVLNYIRTRDDLLAVIHNSWQANPVESLKASILTNVVSEMPNVGLKSLKSQPLNEFLLNIASVTGRRLMIILDQFEEFFLYHQNTKDAFDRQFPEALVKESAAYSFLISIREDSLAKLDRFQGSIPGLFDNYLRINYLDRKAARAAIEKPIWKYNELFLDSNVLMDIEGELIESVLDQVQAGEVVFGDALGGIDSETLQKHQIETPFLQLVMSRLWDETVHSKSKVLQAKTLKKLGGARRIVRTHLDTVLRALSRDEQDLAAQMFNMLVTPSGTKISHTAEDLARYTNVSASKLDSVLEKLSAGDVRILRQVAVAHGRTNEIRYEIYHDVLAQAVLSWRRRYLESIEKAADNKTIEDLTEVIQESGASLRTHPSKPTYQQVPIHRLMPYIEREAIKRYLEMHEVSFDRVQSHIKFRYEFLDPDPIMERVITFDAFWQQGKIEQYFEVINSTAPPSYLFDRVYVMLSKLYNRQQATDVHTQLVLLLFHLPEELRYSRLASRYAHERRLHKTFLPAEELELFTLESIVFSIEDYHELEQRFFEDERRGQILPR